MRSDSSYRGPLGFDRDADEDDDVNLEDEEEDEDDAFSSSEDNDPAESNDSVSSSFDDANPNCKSSDPWKRPSLKLDPLIWSSSIFMADELQNNVYMYIYSRENWGSNRDLVTRKRK